VARARQAQLTKPRGSLGRLEELAAELAFIQGSPQPRARPAQAVIFAADHPVVRHGISAYPADVTRSMLRCFAAGGAAAAVLAARQQIPLSVIDVGVAEPLDEGYGSHASCCILRSPMADLPAGDLRCEDAMPEPTLRAALDAGRSWADSLDTLPAVAIIGEIGIGNTTAASAVAAHLLACAPEEIVGPGTGLSPDAVERKCNVVRDALRRIEGCSSDEALGRIGGRDLAAMTGAMLAFEGSACAILVDGFIASTAALAACRRSPGLRAQLLFAHRSAEPGHTRILEELAARPLLDLEMRLGEASGALTAFPLLELACALHGEMSTFAESRVPDRPSATA